MICVVTGRVAIVLPSALVKTVSLPVLIMFIATASCSDDGDERRVAWSEVQSLKAAYLSAPPADRTEAKQRWADGVRQHLEHWPDHSAAIRTWNDLQLDYAEQLEANGHFAEAEQHYGDLLERLPDQPRATEGLERVRRRQALTIDDLRKLDKGMTTAQVAAFLGLPRPGWDRSSIQDGQRVESWYYRDVTGTIRGLHFREDTLFEVEID